MACAEEECCLHQSFMFNDPVCCVCEVGQPCDYAKDCAAERAVSS